MAILRPLCAWLLPLLVGCGLGGGGGELVVASFPQSGLGPFRLLLPEEAPDLDVPYLLLPPGIDADEPTAAEPGAGDPPDSVLFFVTAQRRGAPAGSFIGRALAAPPLREPPLSEALIADQPWEGGLLRRPTLLRDLPGLPAYALFYQGQDGSLGLATSADGMQLRKAPRPLLAAAAVGGEVDSISAILPMPWEGAEGAAPRLRLYLLQAGRRLLRAEAPLAAVAAGAMGGGPEVPWQITPLGISAADFAVSLSSTESVPAERLVSLSARAVRTPAGRGRVDLLVVAEAGQRRTATAASSYDGLMFEVLARPFLGRGPGLPSALAVTTYQQRALLLLGLRRSAAAQSGIAVGRIP